MSRTDKTRPYWVQLRDPLLSLKLSVHHIHYGCEWRNMEECDIDFPLPRTRRNGTFRNCEWWSAWKDNDKIYGRPGYRRCPELKKDRKARADLRRLRSEWIKTDYRYRIDIDSNENLPSHKWLCRHWYWD